jgi:hypothetical protein
MKMRTALLCLATTALLASTATAGGEPTCSSQLGTDVHGQHIISDYVTGTHSITWPPAGQVGSVMQEQKGVALAGGPGPGFHFPNGFAPGASFCTNSQSKGIHIP